MALKYYIEIMSRIQFTNLSSYGVERLWRSLKHEDVYFKGYAKMCELIIGLTELCLLEHPASAPVLWTDCA